MKVHEYQAKALFRKYGIPVPAGEPAFSQEEALAAADRIGSYPVVVKAQIHAGGRGKGGGVKLAASREAVAKLAGEILGMTLVTHQTGPEGRTVKRLLLEAGQDIKKELYLGILVDRETAGIVIMASTEGGVDIEAVAGKRPEKIIKVYVDPGLGISAFHLRQVAFGLDLPKPSMKQFMAMLNNLYTLFVENDCSLVEVNPLIIDADDNVTALDAKVDFDANALFRHKELADLRDYDEEDPQEVEASRYNLNYINLDGDVGNIVNGAGLAMATMDMIKSAGARPANFMDVGGGATAEMVENALRIILADKKVKAVLINIFGGILRCDVFASGIVEAAGKTGIDIPVVVRMEGTNVDKGKEILASSGFELINADDLSDAAQKIADAVK